MNFVYNCFNNKFEYKVYGKFKKNSKKDNMVAITYKIYENNIDNCKI